MSSQPIPESALTDDQRSELELAHQRLRQAIEAYEKYLELAPDGPHAADVKGVLEGIGEQVKSSYKKK